MQIDWFTVVAQLCNFLVLVWLLKRFLYRPILDAIDAREERIAQTLQQAATTAQEATTERDQLSASNATLDAQRAELLEAARTSAAAERQLLLQQAQAAAEAIGTKRQQDQQQALQLLHTEICHLALTEVIALTRKLLAELANDTLEQNLLEVFTAQLNTMAPDSSQELMQALTAEPAGGLVRSAFTLDEALQQQLQTSINVWASAEIPLKFTTSEDLICGLELSAKGLQSAWNIAAYLEALQTSLREQLAVIGTRNSAELANA